MKYLIGIILVCLSSAFAQDCQSEVKDLINLGYQPSIEEVLNSVKRYTYKATEMKCVSYYEVDSKVTANSFVSKNFCKEKCSRKYDQDCMSPKDGGCCSAAHKRFYYNTISSTCEEFEYGGCQGNGNNYESLEICKKTCVPRPNDCNHPKESGPCFALHKRYFYNSSSFKCEKFGYGGCKGNANNFFTLALCQKSCEK